MNINGKIKEMLCDIGITYNSDYDELEMDSIQFITLVVKIEDEFMIEVPDDFLLISAMNSINNIEIILGNLLGEQGE